MEKALAHCKTALKFASSSLACFLLDYLLFLLFAWGTRSLAWGLVGSNIAARLVSACFNDSLNKYLVFHGGGRTSQDLPQYVLLAAGILTASTDRPGPAGATSQADHRDDPVCGQLFRADTGDLPGKETKKRGAHDPCTRIRNPLRPPEAADPLPCFWRRIFWPRPFWSSATTTFCTRRPSGG